MNQLEILDVLKKYIEDQLLDAPGTKIEPDTPLLEWGILNSFSTTRLVTFVHEKFDIHIPNEEMVGKNFRDLASISRLVANFATENTRS
ncbi:MAG: acyl carrier protein [Pseudonocardiaceae bacterium]